MIVNSELRRRGNPTLRNSSTLDPFYVHRTKTVNQFTEQIVLPYARWYQEILGMSEEGCLRVNRQKLAIVVASLLKGSYGAISLERHPLLWYKHNHNEEEEAAAGDKYLGLGLKVIIEQYGFGWLPHELFNFRFNNFASSGIADQFPFPCMILQRRYESRKRSQYTMSRIMQDVDLVTGRLKMLVEEDLETDLTRRFWIHWRIMRQYHEDVWRMLYESPFEFEGKERERERVVAEMMMKDKVAECKSHDEGATTQAQKKRRTTNVKKRSPRAVSKKFNADTLPLLTHREVTVELGEEPIGIGKGRQWTTRHSIFLLLFYPARVEHRIEDSAAQGWQNLPYLHAVNRAMCELERVVLKEELTGALQMLFNRYCTCLPSTSRDRWLTGDKTKKKSAWIAFDKDGNRIERGDSQEDSSWRTENRIDDDWCWRLPAERAVTEECIQEAKWRLKDNVLWIICELGHED
jgi:hypothetical protein